MTQRRLPTVVPRLNAERLDLLFAYLPRQRPLGGKGAAALRTEPPGASHR